MLSSCETNYEVFRGKGLYLCNVGTRQEIDSGHKIELHFKLIP